MTNKISVLIPAFEAQGHIAGCIESLLDQNHNDWEAIIISDDKVSYEDMLKGAGIEDERLRFASTGFIGSGPGCARNIGYSMGYWGHPHKRSHNSINPTDTKASRGALLLNP